jgi:tetratricopeptide (TPR) repeat protein
LANRLNNYPQATAAYETALAIQPSSVDARYNFALVLKSSGYAVDGVDELKKLLASNPGEVRAHLALGNLYAQQLLDPVRARQEYQKVLDLDPHNSEATDIRYWLLQNQP